MAFIFSAGTDLWGYLFSRTTYVYLNQGIMIGLIFGAFILLRPITNKILSPSNRVWLWCIGWCGAFIPRFFDLFGQFPFIPISFRDLLTPRTFENTVYRTLPMFLPDVTKPGDYTIALPGGAELPVHINDFAFWAVILLFWGISIATMVYCIRQERRLRQIGQQGAKLTDEEKAAYGLENSNIVVRVCKDLPTSFVRLGNDTGTGDGVRYVICVQEELTKEQMRLVMLHEKAHLNHFHVYWKSVMTTIMFVFYWWNPILWVAHRLTCRDMELACDEAVMAQLNEAERREYARMLVELGAGTPMWGAITSFGECDTALRVRRAASWKPRKYISNMLSILFTVILVLFFYCGSLSSPQMETHLERMNWSTYATGSRLLQDLNRITGRDDWDRLALWEIRSTDADEHHLYLLDQEGNWFHCYCVPHEDAYRVSAVAGLQEPPELTNCTELVIPSDWAYP